MVTLWQFMRRHILDCLTFINKRHVKVVKKSKQNDA